MKKLIALLLVITTIFACFGCESAHHTPKGTAEKLLNSLFNGDGESFIDCYAYFNTGLIDKYITDRAEKLDMKSTVAETKNELLELMPGTPQTEISFEIVGIGIFSDRDEEFYDILEKFCYKNTDIVFAIDSTARVKYSIYEDGRYVESDYLYFYRFGDNWFEGSNAIIEDALEFVQQ